MIFIETKLFTKLLPEYLTDDDYRAFQWYLILNPEVGDLVRGSGGVRKIRWSPKGKGKRGGVRIMYYWKNRMMKYGYLLYILKVKRLQSPDRF